MIRVDIKPRQDDRYDIYVSDDNGNALLNSNQGYENVEDAERVVRNLWPPLPTVDALGMEPDDRDVIGLTLEGAALVLAHLRPVHLTVEYRDGRVKSEQLR